ncbi:MAG: amino acid racemase [Pseudomonadota bacterium]
MPHILPTLPDVQWPTPEGVIGVVGVAPFATVDFLTQVYEQADASKDWHFPRVLVDANSKIPSRGRYFDLGETDPSPYIADTIDELISAGASAIVVPCNTAHILIDRWSVRAAVSVVSIVEATLAEVNSSKARSIAVLGSDHLTRYRTYLDPLEKKGLICRELSDEQQALVGKAIGEIKVANTLSKNTSSRFSCFLKELEDSGVETILLGCTELSQAMRCLKSRFFEGAVIDSNKALARAALRRVCSVKHST